MAKVLERRSTWSVDEETKDLWVAEYESIIPLLQNRVNSWTPKKSEKQLKIEQLEKELNELKEGVEE